MRTIRVYSTSFGNGIREVQVQENATWDDLKAAVGISGTNWTGVGRPTKTTYVSSDAGSAILNKDDVQINIFPKQMKAGNIADCQREINQLRNQIEAILDELDDLENIIIETVGNSNNINLSKSDDSFERSLGLD